MLWYTVKFVICIIILFGNNNDNNFVHVAAASNSDNNNNNYDYDHLFDENIVTIYPNITLVTSSGVTNCYDGVLMVAKNGTKHVIDLFGQTNQTISSVIQQYYQALPDHEMNVDSIENLLRSIDIIIKHVVNCSENQRNNNNSNINKNNRTIAASAHYKLGLTSLSDKSEELMNQLTGIEVKSQMKLSTNLNDAISFFPFFSNPPRRGVGNCPQSKENSSRQSSNNNLPATLDYRTLGNIVTPVKDQKTCGACWAFATCAQIESAILLRDRTANITSNNNNNKNNISLSVQQLIDYDHGSSGCNGGHSTSAFAYAKQYGLASADEYPFLNRAKRHRSSLYLFNLHRQHDPRPNLHTIVQIRDYCVRGIAHGTRRQMEHLLDRDIQLALAQHGPLYALINGDGPMMQNYKGGIFDEPTCTDEVSHAVLLVGYDQQSWIVKNSWGSEWGEGGYLRLKRGKNMCGINTEIGYAIL